MPIVRFGGSVRIAAKSGTPLFLPVEQYLDGEIGLGQASKNLGVAYQSIRKWISIYQCNGPTGLLNQPKNKSYSKALKISAVNDYLNGAGSLDDICLKYGIRSHTQLLKWIQVYNSGGILKTSTGGACMKKAKSTTLDERLKIVMECLANDKNYGAMALKYQCSYQQVRNWVKRYEEMGSKGLEDRRGRRVGSLPSRTPEEELRDRIVELERKNIDLQSNWSDAGNLCFRPDNISLLLISLHLNK